MSFQSNNNINVTSTGQDNQRYMLITPTNVQHTEEYQSNQYNNNVNDVNNTNMNESVDNMIVDNDHSHRFTNTTGFNENVVNSYARRPNRPVFKLSVKLIETYKNINKIYYENKKKAKEKASQGSSRTLGYHGVHNDGYDDDNFDYILHAEGDGELFYDRYLIKHRIGKGSFGQVVSAIDQVTKEEVAIKIIKSRKPFRLQAQTEIDLLNLITNKQIEEDNDCNCVSLITKFDYRNHQCIVFEMLSYNLYELLKNSRFRGVSLGLVRKFGRQLLTALEFLSRPDVDIIHCDLKPENILLRHPKRSAIKIIDFGSSCRGNKKTYTYIQSRFYRSPEVLLGLPYDHKIDMWSLACVLVEMHTGEPLFGGKDQLDQMCRIVDILGMPPFHMIENSSDTAKKLFFTRYDNQFPPLPAEFDFNRAVISPDNSYSYVLKKSPLHRDLHRVLNLDTVIGVNSGGPSGRRFGEAGHSPENYEEFLDFIKRFLVFDPSQRISASEALDHPFITEKRKKTSTDNSISNININSQRRTTGARYDHPTAHRALNDVITIEPETQFAPSPRRRLRHEETEDSSSPRVRSRSAPTGSHNMQLRTR